jgi:hypothetical protein
MLIPFYIYLLPFSSNAQDCTSTIYVEAQTVKAGQLVTISGGVINAQPGKQIVVEQDGRLIIQASRRIELNYGFKALNGSGLSASIVACDPGGPDPGSTVVYPIPTDRLLHVKAAYTFSAFRLSDMSGATLLVGRDINDTTATLDLTSLKSGYYILEIIVGKSVAEMVRIEKR